jgi:hypothetical protein
LHPRILRAQTQYFSVSGCGLKTVRFKSSSKGVEAIPCGRIFGENSDSIRCNIGEIKLRMASQIETHQALIDSVWQPR